MKNKIKTLLSLISEKYPDLLSAKSRLRSYKEIFNNKIIAEVESENRNILHEVYIDLDNDIYICSCESWQYLQYILKIPYKYVKIFNKKEIILCKHIVAVLRFLRYLYKDE